MKSANFREILLASLVATTAIGCSGKLKVGDKNKDAGAAGEESVANGGTGGSAAGRASAGHPGSSGMATTGGTGGSTSGTGGSTSGAGASTPPTTDSTDGCPLGPLQPDTACATRGLSCVYPLGDDGYHETCDCVPVVGAGPLWKCTSEADNPSCPDVFPGDGTNCFGYLYLDCRYAAQRECRCANDPPAWDCSKQPIPDAPSSPDPDQIISALTDEDRDQLCVWLNDTLNGRPGFPSPPDGPVDDSGYTNSGACHSGDVTFCPQTVVGVSRAQCASNLKLSTCGAAVSALTTCVLGILSRQCGALAYNCYDYLVNPGCDGTMVVDSLELPCNLQVE
jgi:hypothetical protein